MVYHENIYILLQQEEGNIMSINGIWHLLLSFEPLSQVAIYQYMSYLVMISTTWHAH